MSHQLVQGDGLTRMRDLADAEVDALISDPPYGTTDLAWDEPVDWPGFWSEAERICKPFAVIALFSAQPFTTQLINSKRAWFRYELIWEKPQATGFLNANRRPLTCHENILVFSRRFMGSTYHPQKSPGEPYVSRHGENRCGHYGQVRAGVTVNSGDRHPRSVLRFGKAAGERQHPTQKPLALMQWLVRTYSNPGELVLDPFMGSGSTGVAAVQEGRRFTGFERERQYYEVARDRMRLH